MTPPLLERLLSTSHSTPCALGRDRTCDLRFRKPLLYPLSYEGGDGAKCGAKFADTHRVIEREVTSAS
ncbi:MAG: hypothetical protein RLZ84_1250 [Actinomycetota bacterium]